MSIEDNRDFLFLNFLELKKISLSIVEQLELTKLQIHDFEQNHPKRSHTPKISSQISLPKTNHNSPTIHRPSPSPSRHHSTSASQKNSPNHYPASQDDLSDPGQTQNKKGQEYIQCVLKKFHPFKECLGILENQFKGFLEYNRLLENTIVEMNTFFKKFLTPLNSFIHIKSSKEKVVTENSVFKGNLREISGQLRRIELRHENESLQSV
jgi:hypothetical protein